MPNNITDIDKLEEIQREIGLRKKVYSKRVDEGTMYANTANRRIEIMLAIESDYKKIVNKNQLAIFQS